MTVTLAYEHYSNTLEPKHLDAQAVWDVAYMARRHICTQPARPKLPVETIIARSRRLRVNGLGFETCWDVRQGLTDDLGRPLFGVAEFDAAAPRTVMIAVDAYGNGQGESLVRSTVAHELGHAIFDGPGWVRQGERLGQAALCHRLERTRFKSSCRQKSIDWVEWRADEFMGAFLAPRTLLHAHLHKRAAALAVPMIENGRAGALPLINGPAADPDALEHINLDLAETFGLSPAFVATRLRSFGLITGRGHRS